MENLKVLFPVHIRKKIKNNLWLNDLEEIRIRRTANRACVFRENTLSDGYGR